MSRRILLGCADPDVIDRVASVASELGDELVGVTTSSAETIDAVAAAAPDVLIVAESLGPVPALDLIRQVSRQDPFTGILLLTGATDQEVYRVAMEAGARSVAPITFTVDDLGQRLENAAAWARIARAHLSDQAANRSHRTGQVLALAGSKGGVGTTTLAVHIALAAARAGRQVCLVDLDLQSGDVASLLDITHRRDIVDLVAVAEEVTAQSLDDALYRHSSGLNVLLAPREGERGEEVTEQVSRAILGAVKSRFDMVVVDVGSVLTPAGAAAVEIADRAVIVVTPDVLSARSARRTVQVWERLQLRREADVTVLINRVSRQVEIQPDLAGKLVRVPVLGVTVPAAFRALEAATNTGDPARLVDRDLRRAIARVAEALDAHAGSTKPAPAAARDRRDRNNRSRTPRAALTVPAPPAVSAPPAVPTVSAPPTHAPLGAALPALAIPAGPTIPAVDVVPGTLPVGENPPRASGNARGRRFGRRARPDGGQTAIEFTGMLPIILVVVFALFQAGLIGYSHIAAGQAAARGARVAVSPLADAGQIRSAAISTLPGQWKDGAQVSVNGRPNDPNASVDVTVTTPGIFPAIRSLFGDDVLTVRSRAQMRYEGWHP